MRIALLSAWLLCLLCLLLQPVACVLAPVNTPSILISPSNQYELATYTFSFTLEQSISPAATLEIEFPGEYQPSDLALANCTVSGLICSLPYYTGIDTSLTYQVTLANITNPTAGGVGNFQIRTKLGANVIEESKIFSNAGIRGSVDPFLYIELTSNNGIAGMNASYSLRFKTVQSYPYAVSFELSLGTSYNISVLQQQYASIDATQEYTIVFGMRNPYSIDAIADLPAKIFKGTYLLVRGQVKNPTFQAAPLKCSMTASPWLGTNSQYKVVDYDFAISALYPAITSSQLEIIVPEYFARYNVGVLNTLFYYGYDGNTLSFLGDRVFAMTINNSTSTMKYRLRLQNPYIVGDTSPFRLSLRYQGSIYMFDESTCTTIISSLVPADLTRPWTALSTNSTVGASNNITLSLPAMPGSNLLQLKFSPEWTLLPSGTIIVVGGSYTVLSTTFPDSWTISVTLNQNITSGTSITLSGLVNPPVNGSYLVEVTCGFISYSDIVVVSGPSSNLLGLSVLGNVVSLSFSSTGITSGAISIDFSTGSSASSQIDCSLNNQTVDCAFISNTNVEIRNLTLASGSNNTIAVSGVTVSGSRTFVLREYIATTSQGSVEMRQVASSTINSFLSTTTSCGATNVTYGLPATIVVSSCISIANPTQLLIVTDSAVDTLQSTVALDSTIQPTSNPLYKRSLLLSGVLPSTFTNLSITNLSPSITPATSILKIYAVNSSVSNLYTYTLNINQQNDLPTTLTLSSLAKQDVGVIYNFTVSALANTPTGSLIIIFPTDYSLNQSAAWATSNFSGYPSPSVESSRVVVNNVQLQAGQQYLISVFGVINPNLNKVVGFSVSFVQTSPSLIVYAANANSINLSLTSSLSKSAMTVGINFYPQNALTIADYYFTLTVPRTVPAKSYLFLNFPGEFVTLGSPICRLQNLGYSSCTIISNLTIQVQLSVGVASNTPMTVIISNISNPFQGTTNLFYFSVVCNIQTIADGYSTPLLILQSCESKTLVQWSVSPLTVGEQAQYTFKYLPTYDVTYQDILFVRFPYEFDASLGQGLTCLFTDALGFESVVDCHQTNFMEVQLYIGQYSVFTGTPFTVKIVGVTNVNNPTGIVSIGVKKQTSNYYTESASTLVGVTPWRAASTLTFNNLAASNFNIRLSGTYTVEFYSSLPISCSTVSLFVVFPSNLYDLQLNQSVPCSSPQFSATCQIRYNNRIEVVPVGIQKIPAGLISIVLLGVDNPLDESIVSAYHIQVLDRLNKLVVARTYSNLQFYSMQFVALGPYIKFNDEQSITMNEGTTIGIPVAVTQPLILQIKVRGFGPFAFDPYLLTLEPGSTRSLVKISSPKGQTGTFTITWRVSGDLTPLYYTPVKKTTVYVKTVLTSVEIIPMQSPLLIVANDCSSLVQVRLQYPPDANLVVEVYDNGTAPLYSLQFLRNETLKSFQICNKTTNGSLRFQLSGINAPNYHLINAKLPYVVGATPLIPITVFSFNSSTKTTSNFNVLIDSNCSAMLILSLNNSDVLSSINRSSLGTTLLSMLPLTTSSKVTQFQYTTPNTNMSVGIDGLRPNISYQATLYVLLANNKYVPAGVVSFWTQPFDLNCELTFTFSAPVSDIDKWAFLQTVSYVLSVPISSIAINPEYTSQTASKLILGQQANATDQSPSPLALSSNLYIRPTRLQSRVKSLVLQNPYATRLGPITDVPNVQSIYMSSYDINQLNFVVQVSSSGNLFAVLNLGNTSASLTTQQVYLGLDSKNLQSIKSIHLNPCQANDNSLSFNNLSPFQWYTLCVVVGNLDPNPNLNYTVQCLSAETVYPPSHVVLKIKWAGSIFALTCILILTIL